MKRTIGPVWLRSILYDSRCGFFAGSSGFYNQRRQTRFFSYNESRTQRYILNSFIKTGFSVGTACAARGVEENARTKLQRTAGRDFGSNMDGRRAGEKVAGKLSRVISETPTANQIRPFGEHKLLCSSLAVSNDEHPI